MHSYWCRLSLESRRSKQCLLDTKSQSESSLLSDNEANELVDRGLSLATRMLLEKTGIGGKVDDEIPLGILLSVLVVASRGRLYSIPIAVDGLEGCNLDEKWPQLPSLMAGGLLQLVDLLIKRDRIPNFTGGVSCSLLAI